MYNTIKIVDETFANSTLQILGGHALSDVNTGANIDEVLLQDLKMNC